MLQQGPGLLFQASAPCRRRYESVWVRNLKKWKTRYEEERPMALRRCGREGFGALPVMQRSGMMLGGGDCLAAWAHGALLDCGAGIGERRRHWGFQRAPPFGHRRSKSARP